MTNETSSRRCKADAGTEFLLNGFAGAVFLRCCLIKFFGAREPALKIVLPSRIRRVSRHPLRRGFARIGGCHTSPELGGFCGIVSGFRHVHLSIAIGFALVHPGKLTIEEGDCETADHSAQCGRGLTSARLTES